jgi:nucleoside-diphosphate-sugar epimerase
VRRRKGVAVTAVLVTGASGFVGRSMCRELKLRGHDVRGATRTSCDLEVPVVPVGNLGPDTDWSAALAGRTIVIHLAAHVHVMGGQPGETLADFDRVNVEGTETLALQAARADIKRFVFLSSVKVNGESSERRALVENDPARPVDAYGASKAEAEYRLQVIAVKTGMEIVIVRSPLVYGPGVKANFLRLLRTIDAGVPLPFASIDNRRSLVYLGNLADALAACVTHPAAANQTFLVSDDHDVSSPELVREIAKALGRKPRLFPLPASWLNAVGLLTGRSQQLNRLTGSFVISISSIKSTLGWAPPFTMQEGLKETVSWYRSLTY